MTPLSDASATSVRAFVRDCTEPGATVITDGWQGYHWPSTLGYRHDQRSQRTAKVRGEDPGELVPSVHRVASLAKRWLLGTHQGAESDARLTSYLNVFVFRFNLRCSRSRRMVFYRALERTVVRDPVHYRDIIATDRTRRSPHGPPRTCRHPPTLERHPVNRPWRCLC